MASLDLQQSLPCLSTFYNGFHYFTSSALDNGLGEEKAATIAKIAAPIFMLYCLKLSLLLGGIDLIAYITGYSKNLSETIEAYLASARTALGFKS